MTVVLWVLAACLVLLGLAGTVLPALPGAPLVFAGLLLAAWIDGFQKVGIFPLVILGFLTVLTLVVDVVATALGAKKVGASKSAIVGSAIGTVVGLFFGIPGLLLGPFVGALLGEYSARKNWEQAGKAGLGTWLGIVLGTAVKLSVLFFMLGLFALAYIF